MEPAHRGGDRVDNARGMRLDRGIGLLVLAVLSLVGCGGGATPEAGPRTTYDYITAVRPLAYENAHAACNGHSLTSLAYEYGTSGRTIVAAASNWARQNQPDLRLRTVTFRGCRDGLRETTPGPMPVRAPPLTEPQIEIYVVEYATCLGLTIADLVQDYGLDPSGLTLHQAVQEVVRASFGRAYREVAFDACLAAIHGEPPRYGS